MGLGRATVPNATLGTLAANLSQGCVKAPFPRLSRRNSTFTPQYNRKSSSSCGSCTRKDRNQGTTCGGRTTTETPSPDYRRFMTLVPTIVLSTWHDVIPAEGALVVNLGDLTAR